MTVHLQEAELLLCDVAVGPGGVGVDEVHDVLVELLQSRVSVLQGLQVTQVTGKGCVRWDNEG